MVCKFSGISSKVYLKLNKFSRLKKHKSIFTNINQYFYNNHPPVLNKKSTILKLGINANLSANTCG